VKATSHRIRRSNASASSAIGGPFVWTFDGPVAACISDMEDTLRRLIVQLGEVAAISVLIELSLPALKRRVDAGDAIQPAWGEFLDRLVQRYGLPAAARVRPLRDDGPLAILVIAYRS
jgi:hypothetical protein